MPHTRGEILLGDIPSCPDLDSFIVNMVTFLELPREIRDKVLSLVLSHHEDAPTDVSDASGRAEFDDIRFVRGMMSRVMYIEHPPMRDSTSLLLLNHQLHEETQDAIRLLPTNSFVLDVIIAHERKLWATWLYAPVLTTRVDRVYTTIRTIGCYSKGSSLFKGGDGGPPQITM